MSPLAPYLFLIVGKTRTHLNTKAVSEDRLRELFSQLIKNNEASRNMRMISLLWLGIKNGM